MLLVAASLVVLLGMAALAIDVVTLYVARTEAQRAADAGALAGARAFVISGFTSGQLGLPSSGTVQNLVCANSGSGGPVANLQATAAAAQNLVSGQAAQVTAIACNFSQPENPQITVTVQRTGLPTFFARIWGRRGSTVTASATGEAVNTSGTTMPVHLTSVKPWLIPNCNPLTERPDCQTSHYFIDSSFALNNPTAYIGQSFVFHQYDPGSSAGGVFYPLDMSTIQASVCPAASSLPSGSCSEV